MHVTIKDVAKLTGFAPSTVSRVIANSPKISNATKEIVYKAMKELNYQPNVIARSLANRKTYTLGLILPAKSEEIFDNPFFIQAMRGLSKYAQEQGYYVMYNYCHTIEDEVKTAETFIRSKWVDGIILMASRSDDPCMEYLLENKHPFVVIGRPKDNKNKILWVDNDNVKAMYDVVKKLIDKGRKRIAFLGGEKQFIVNQHRFEGYALALKEVGIEIDASIIIEDLTSQIDAAKAMARLLEKEIIDAYVGTDDLIVYGAYKSLIELNIDNISVIGFNNTPMAIFNNPPFSSVDINSERLGMDAAKLLIAKLEGEDIGSNSVEVETSFIERGFL